MATATKKGSAVRGKEAKAAAASKSKASGRTSAPTDRSYMQGWISTCRGILDSMVNGATVEIPEDGPLFTGSAEYVLYSLDLAEEILGSMNSRNARAKAKDLRNAIQRSYVTGRDVSNGSKPFSVNGKDVKLTKKLEGLATELRNSAQQVWNAARKVEDGVAKFSG